MAFERKFEVVGRYYKDGAKYDTYYVLQKLSDNAPNAHTNGRMALAIPARHEDTPRYNTGAEVDIGWSDKYKHFYIERRND